MIAGKTSYAEDLVVTMSALPINFDPYNPIPNNPFYSPESSYLQGPLGPLVIGSGLSVSAQGVISSSGGGGGGGTVTSITAGTGLTGGVITSVGTIALGLSGAVAGTYTYPALSVDAYGRVTSISSGSPVTSVSVNSPLTIFGSVSAPTISIQQANTSQVGVTQLNNTTSSNLTNQALTAAAGKNLQDQINALAQNANGLILAGTLNASTSNVVSATTAGISGGFTSGSPVPAASPAINDYYLIVTTGSASYTPTGGAPILNVIVGDYILVSSGVWTILRIGPVAGAYATTTTAGLVQLATSAQAIAGTDPNLALTPFTGACSYVPKNVYTGKGQVVAGTGTSSFLALASGTDGYVLTSDSSCANGIKWAASTGGGGGIASITFNSPLNSTPSPVSSGVASVNINAASTTACGAVQLATPGDTQTGLSTTLAVTPFGGAASYVAIGCFTAKGQVLAATGAGTYVALNVGTNGQALLACSACPSGLTWGSSVTPACSNTIGGVYGVGEPGLGLNVSVGRCSLFSLTTGLGNTALGLGAGASLASGCYNVSVGTCSLVLEATGVANTAVGTGALDSQNGASNNTALGASAGCSLTTGGSNIFIGAATGANSVSGSCNVAIGTCLDVTNVNGSCQLAIGFAAGSCWLTGCSNCAIRPAAGIMDCTGSTGTSGQVLCSNGSNAIVWAAPGGYCAATVSAGSCLVYCGLQLWLPAAGNNSLQIALASGSANSSYLTTSYVGGLAPGSISSSSCTLTTTPQYFGAGLGFSGTGIQDGSIKVLSGGPAASVGTFNFCGFYWVAAGPAYRVDLCVQKLF